jgi:hypothetical protein
MTTSVTDEMAFEAKVAYMQANNAQMGFDASIRAALAAALRSQGKVEGWQPIDTAPKDGSIIDLWSVKEGRLIGASYSTGGEGFYASFFDSTFETWDQRKVKDATHWVSQPAPPKDIRHEH